MPNNPPIRNLSDVILLKITASDTKIRKFKLPSSLIRLQWPTLQGIYAARHSDPPSHGSQIEQAGSNCGSEAVWISLLRFILSRAASTIVFLHRLLSPSLSHNSRDLRPPRSFHGWIGTELDESLRLLRRRSWWKIKIKWKGKNYCLQSLGFFIKFDILLFILENFFFRFGSVFWFFYKKISNFFEGTKCKIIFWKFASYIKRWKIILKY